MKTFAIVTFALSSLAITSAVQAQERQATVYSGPASVELPASMLRGSTAATISSGEASSARKVRIVLQSPYGN